MESRWKAIGHEKQKKFLSLYLGKETIPHAFLFIGPKGVGKSMIAKEFAEMILDRSIGSSPDFSYFDSNDLDTAKVRELLSGLAVKPFFGKKKVCVIDSIEAMSSQSANSLLKTLEEPSASTIIILISHSFNILSTVLSRVVSLRFGTLNDTEMKKFIMSRADLGIDEKVVANFRGRPGFLASTLENKPLKEAVRDYLPGLEKMTTSTAYERLLLLNKLSEIENDILSPLLEIWLGFIQNSMSTKPERFMLADRVMKGIQLLSKSMNKKLVLQRLLLVS